MLANSGATSGSNTVSSGNTAGGGNTASSSSGSGTSSATSTVVSSTTDGSENTIASPPGTVDSLLPPETMETPVPSYIPSNAPSMTPTTSGTVTGIGSQIGTVLGIVFGTGSEGGDTNTPSPSATYMPIVMSDNKNHNMTGEYGGINGTYSFESGYPMSPTLTPTSIGTELLVNVSVISSTNTTDWFIQNDKEEALSNVTSLIFEGMAFPSSLRLILCPLSSPFLFPVLILCPPPFLPLPSHPLSLLQQPSQNTTSS